MIERPVPYIGVTGIQTPEEAAAVSAVFAEALDGHSHMGMIGVLADRTLLGHTDMEPHRRMPKDFETLVACLQAIRGKLLPAIHFEAGAGARDTLGVVELFRHISELCSVVQWNGRLSAVALDALHAAHPNVTVIAQLRPDVLRQPPKDIVETVQKARQHLHYVLIDPSCGRGILGDDEQTTIAMMHISDACPELGVGAAGGLRPDNVRHFIQKIRRLTASKDFSIDTESGVRDEHDVLDITQVRAYAQVAAEALRS